MEFCFLPSFSITLFHVFYLPPLYPSLLEGPFIMPYTNFFLYFLLSVQPSGLYSYRLVHITSFYYRRYYYFPLSIPYPLFSQRPEKEDTPSYLLLTII